MEAVVREETARTMANVVMAAVAVGAAVIILRTPPLRRLAFGLARTAIITGIPAWLSRELNHAWQASEARRTPPPEDHPVGTAPQPSGDGFPSPEPSRPEDEPDLSAQNLNISGVSSRRI